MKITVASPTYGRAWSLPYMLEGLLSQSRPPDEVIIVLKPSGDGSEEVLRRYEGRLPLRVLMQRSGGFVQAVQMAIDAATGDLILFIDDDAMPEERWIEKYERFFEEVPDAGGATGRGIVAHIIDGHPEPVREATAATGNHPHHATPWRRPLPELNDYCEYLSVAGLNGRTNCESQKYYKSTSLWGANMAFRKHAIAGAPIGELYEGSKKGFHNESLLAYIAVRRGYA
ncbi:MAG: glycosyltransferase family A protein, partial [Conexivisphaera sp.]